MAVKNRYYSFTVSTNQDFLNIKNNLSGKDFSRILIKKGTYYLDFPIDFTDLNTTYIYAEDGAEIKSVSKEILFTNYNENNYIELDNLVIYDGKIAGYFTKTNTEIKRSVLVPSKKKSLSTGYVGYDGERNLYKIPGYSGSYHANQSEEKELFYFKNNYYYFDREKEEILIRENETWIPLINNVAGYTVFDGIEIKATLNDSSSTLRYSFDGKTFINEGYTSAVFKKDDNTKYYGVKNSKLYLVSEDEATEIVSSGTVGDLFYFKDDLLLSDSSGNKVYKLGKSAWSEILSDTYVLYTADEYIYLNGNKIVPDLTVETITPVSASYYKSGFYFKTNLGIIYYSSDGTNWTESVSASKYSVKVDDKYLIVCADGFYDVTVENNTPTYKTILFNEPYVLSSKKIEDSASTQNGEIIYEKVTCLFADKESSLRTDLSVSVYACWQVYTRIKIGSEYKYIFEKEITYENSGIIPYFTRKPIESGYTYKNLCAMSDTYTYNFDDSEKTYTVAFPNDLNAADNYFSTCFSDFSVVGNHNSGAAWKYEDKAYTYLGAFDYKFDPVYLGNKLYFCGPNVLYSIDSSKNLKEEILFSDPITSFECTSDTILICSTTAAFSIDSDGVSSYLSDFTPSKIVYGNGYFVALDKFESCIKYSNNGKTWYSWSSSGSSGSSGSSDSLANPIDIVFVDTAGTENDRFICILYDRIISFTTPGGTVTNLVKISEGKTPYSNFLGTSRIGIKSANIVYFINNRYFENLSNLEKGLTGVVVTDGIKTNDGWLISVMNDYYQNLDIEYTTDFVSFEKLKSISLTNVLTVFDGRPEEALRAYSFSKINGNIYIANYRFNETTKKLDTVTGLVTDSFLGSTTTFNNKYYYSLSSQRELAFDFSNIGNSKMTYSNGSNLLFYDHNFFNTLPNEKETIWLGRYYSDSEKEDMTSYGIFQEGFCIVNASGASKLNNYSNITYKYLDENATNEDILKAINFITTYSFTDFSTYHNSLKTIGFLIDKIEPIDAETYVNFFILREMESDKTLILDQAKSNVIEDLNDGLGTNCTTIEELYPYVTNFLESEESSTAVNIYRTISGWVYIKLDETHIYYVRANKMLGGLENGVYGGVYIDYSLFKEKYANDQLLLEEVGDKITELKGGLVPCFITFEDKTFYVLTDKTKRTVYESPDGNTWAESGSFSEGKVTTDSTQAKAEYLHFNKDFVTFNNTLFLKDHYLNGSGAWELYHESTSSYSSYEMCEENFRVSNNDLTIERFANNKWEIVAKPYGFVKKVNGNYYSLSRDNKLLRSEDGSYWENANVATEDILLADSLESADVILRSLLTLENGFSYQGDLLRLSHCFSFDNGETFEKILYSDYSNRPVFWPINGGDGYFYGYNQKSRGGTVGININKEYKYFGNEVNADNCYIDHDLVFYTNENGLFTLTTSGSVKKTDKVFDFAFYDQGSAKFFFHGKDGKFYQSSEGLSNFETTDLGNLALAYRKTSTTSTTAPYIKTDFFSNTYYYSDGTNYVKTKPFGYNIFNGFVAGEKINFSDYNLGTGKFKNYLITGDMTKYNKVTIFSQSTDKNFIKNNLVETNLMRKYLNKGVFLDDKAMKFGDYLTFWDSYKIRTLKKDKETFFDSVENKTFKITSYNNYNYYCPIVSSSSTTRYYQNKTAGRLISDKYTAGSSKECLRIVPSKFSSAQLIDSQTTIRAADSNYSFKGSIAGSVLFNEENTAATYYLRNCAALPYIDGKTYYPVSSDNDPYDTVYEYWNGLSTKNYEASSKSAIFDLVNENMEGEFGSLAGKHSYSPQFKSMRVDITTVNVLKHTATTTTEGSTITTTKPYIYAMVVPTSSTTKSMCLVTNNNGTEVFESVHAYPFVANGTSDSSLVFDGKNTTTLSDLITNKGSATWNEVTIAEGSDPAPTALSIDNNIYRLGNGYIYAESYENDTKLRLYTISESSGTSGTYFTYKQHEVDVTGPYPYANNSLWAKCGTYYYCILTNGNIGKCQITTETSTITFTDTGIKAVGYDVISDSYLFFAGTVFDADGNALKTISYVGTFGNYNVICSNGKIINLNNISEVAYTINGYTDEKFENIKYLFKFYDNSDTTASTDIFYMLIGNKNVNYISNDGTNWKTENINMMYGFLRFAKNLCGISGDGITKISGYSEYEDRARLGNYLFISKGKKLYSLSIGGSTLTEVATLSSNIISLKQNSVNFDLLTIECEGGKCYYIQSSDYSGGEFTPVEVASRYLTPASYRAIATYFDLEGETVND